MVQQLQEERERLLRDRIRYERIERERLEHERQERDRQERERLEQEQQERERQERIQRLYIENQERERERLERVRQERVRQERESQRLQYAYALSQFSPYDTSSQYGHLNSYRGSSSQWHAHPQTQSTVYPNQLQQADRRSVLLQPSSPPSQHYFTPYDGSIQSYSVKNRRTTAQYGRNAPTQASSVADNNPYHFHKLHNLYLDQIDIFQQRSKKLNNNLEPVLNQSPKEGRTRRSVIKTNPEVLKLVENRSVLFVCAKSKRLISRK